LVLPKLLARYAVKKELIEQDFEALGETQ